MEVLDAEVLATLHDDLFRPGAIEAEIRRALAALAPTGRDDARRAIEQELSAVQTECTRLAEAIGRGGPLDALLTRLTDRQARLSDLERALTTTTARPAIDLTGFEKRLRVKLAEWRGLLSRHVEAGREVLRTLLVGPMKFTPVNDGRRKGYAFAATIALDRLLSGVVTLPPSVASPTGVAPFMRGCVLRHAA